MKKKMDLMAIMVEWLQEHGFDGLYSSGFCACRIGDIMPCGEPRPDCAPGYLAPCPDDCENGGECDFHISARRPGAARGGRDG